MKNLSINLLNSSYEIMIGNDILSSSGAVQQLSALLAGKSCLIISDSNVYPLYGEGVTKLADRAGVCKVDSFVFSAGEESKRLSTIEKIYHFAISKGLDRGSVVLALGGGVTGDIAGFFASTYMRGIDFVQIPTSLLAMVDSSVGGKVGVDLEEGKNLVGAFYQPRLVLADISVLQTVPKRELASGLAEVVKYGMIMDAEFVAWLEMEAVRINNLDKGCLEQLVSRCCGFKAEVVEEDEKEHGRRAILNYGHTFGHALEVVGGYRLLNHGEGVAIGMGMAIDFALALGLLTGDAVELQDRVLAKLNLPVVMPKCDKCRAEEVLQYMYRDKKVKDGKLVLVLTDSVGSVIMRKCDEKELLLEKIRGRFAKA